VVPLEVPGKFAAGLFLPEKGEDTVEVSWTLLRASGCLFAPGGH
jgi:hypothetical protein